MTLSLIVEDGTGKADANSYATAAEGTSYFERHLYASDWTAATTATKEAALVWATELLDNHARWLGAKQSEDQALAWPRAGAVDREGFTFASNVVPVQVKRATCELARYLLAEDRSAEADTRGFKQLGAGPLSMTIDKEDRKGTLPDSVLAMLWGLAEQGGGRVRTARLLRT